MWMDPFKTMLKLPGKKNKLKLWNEWETNPLREMMFQKCAEINEAFFAGQKNNVTERFKDYIKFQIGHNANMLVAIESPPGEGKSKVGLWLVTLWVRFMKELKEYDASYEYAFNSAQTRNKLAEIDDGDVVLKDEDSFIEGEGKTTALAEETNFLETMRYTQKSVVICAPHIALLSGMTVLLRVMAKLSTEDPNKFQSRVLVYHLEEDQPGRSPKFILLGYLIADVNEIDPEIIKEYEQAKGENYRRMEKNRGAVGAGGKEEVKIRKQYAKKILRCALKHKWPMNPQNPSKKALDNYFDECDIPKSVNAEKIKEYVVQFYREEYGPATPGPSSPVSPPIVPGPFSGDFQPTDLEAIFTQIKLTSQDENIERAIDIYRTSRDSLKTGRDMEVKYGLSAERIRQIKSKIAGEVNRLRGDAYEAFLVPKYQTIFKKVTHIGGIGKPDIICEDPEIVIYSIKCYDFNRGSYSLPYAESHAEIEYARELFTQTKNKHIRVICHLLNCFNYKIYEFEFDSQVIQVSTPYANRNITIKLGEFTRDPTTDPWVILPI